MGGGPPGPGIRFDKAEYAQGPAEAACTACRAPIRDTYFEVNGKVVCSRCRGLLAARVAQGSGGGFVKASLLGFLAAALSAALWYAVIALTHAQFGLLAVLVGFLVGGAVRKGSGGRGGWTYQALAMVLTYVAIASSFVPLIGGEVLKSARAARAPASPAPPAAGAPNAVPAAVPQDAPTPGAPPPGAPAPKPLSPGRTIAVLVAFGAIVFGISLIAPFAAGFRNIIGLFIIGIALYEAWKLNRRIPLRITGPYRLGVPRPSPASGV